MLWKSCVRLRAGNLKNLPCIQYREWVSEIKSNCKTVSDRNVVCFLRQRPGYLAQAGDNTGDVKVIFALSKEAWSLSPTQYHLVFLI